MRLLLDQNLSRRLVAVLAAEFADSRHVAECGLDTATDDQVWDFARQRGYAIVSKDSDFRQLAFLHGPPPKVIWIRTGNVTTNAIAQLLRVNRSRIEAFDAATEESLLALPLIIVDETD